MKSSEIREKYLRFFEKRGHKRITAAPLVLENDPTTLFTSSGMQPLVPYLMGEVHPEGRRLVNSQPSLRVQDIDEVGDNRHTTYFEMLGNWSLGDYFKKEQLAWVLEFFTKELGLSKEKLWVSVFEGNKAVPKDTESAEIWEGLGIPKKRIFFYGVDKNWWGRSGVPSAMPAGEIGGPDSEVFYEFTKVKHDPKFGKACHPNCDCGRFLEIGNSVFIQYRKQADGSLKELPQKNVDFGGGLERTAAAVADESDIFKTDLYWPMIKAVEEVTGKKYGETAAMMRVVADHVRAANALAADGVVPGNKLQGYVLRRLIRRAAVKMRSLKGEVTAEDFAGLTDSEDILAEVAKFKQTLERGLKLVGKVAPFDLYQTYGFPLELTIELLGEKGERVDQAKFKKEFEKHQEASRTASAGTFKGGLADHSEEVTRLHTATHLLHEALRRVLGKHVQQKGSNITSERLRFDFSHDGKVTAEELTKIEEMVNAQIKRDLAVTSEAMSFEAAKRAGALAFFGERYGERVRVFTIGDFSKEVCGGPHVSHTGELGRVRIMKEEGVSAGTRRIYATLLVDHR